MSFVSTKVVVQLDVGDTDCNDNFDTLAFSLTETLKVSGSFDLSVSGIGASFK